MSSRALILPLLLTSCMDITPVVIEIDAGTITFDAPAPVTDVGDADAPELSACDRCIFGLTDAEVGCAEEINKCEKPGKLTSVEADRCGKTIRCARANGCTVGKDFKGMLDCGIPCAQAAGVTDQTSPEALVILEVVACIQEKCKAACKIP